MNYSCNRCSNYNEDKLVCRRCIDTMLRDYLVTTIPGNINANTYTFKSHKSINDTDYPIFIVSISPGNMMISGDWINNYFTIPEHIKSIFEFENQTPKNYVDSSNLGITDHDALVVYKIIQNIIKKLKVQQNKTANSLNRVRKEMINTLESLIIELDGFSSENVIIEKGKYKYKSHRSNVWDNIRPGELILQDLIAEINYLTDIKRLVK